MKSILKDFYCLDIIERLDGYIPADVYNFGFWARIIVGEKDLGGEESFDIMICTPKWILENYKENDIIIGQYHLIVLKYNYNNIYSYLRDKINSIEKENWSEIGNQIGKIGKWEFEDYRDI